MRVVKFLAALPIALLLLIANPHPAAAMWVAASNAELVATSDVIIDGELIGQVHAVINGVKLFLGVLKADEILKGEQGQPVFLLALPSREGPRLSTDISYSVGQKGLWCLRKRESQGTTGLYLADHPQRFLLPTRDADRIQAIRTILIE